MLRANKASQKIILRGFLFLSALIVLSCATVSPVDSARERPASFAAIEEVRLQWQEFTGNIGYFHGKIKNPKLDFWAIRIDLSAPDTRIVVRGGAADGNGTESTRTLSTSTKSTKVSSFVRDNGLSAGINAVPFDVVSANENRPIQNMGIVISGGELISPVNPRYDALVFYADGKAAIVRQSAIDTDSIKDIENAIGGFHSILKNGQPEERTADLQPRHPRSAAGISANGRYLYLLVIDGRRPGSIGSTEKETALLLRSLGSWDGINFDGGGSSALVLRYEDGKARPVNTPIHNGIPGQERAVAGCIGVY
jgi:hypothetical protein